MVAFLNKLIIQIGNCESNLFLKNDIKISNFHPCKLVHFHSNLARVASCLWSKQYSFLFKKAISIYKHNTLRKLVYHFLSNWMGYYWGHSFLSDSYPIQSKRKWTTGFLSVLLLFIQHELRSNPDWKKSHRLSERPASLGIMRSPLRAPLKS